MIQKILMSSLLCALLLMSGCGNDEAQNALQTQQDLDKGNYQAVISKYEGFASTNDEYMALAAAYMQKAGLGLADLIIVISESGDDQDSGAFASFVKSSQKRTSSTALVDLEKSSNNYKKVVSDCMAGNLSASQKDACLYRGLAQTLKAATTIGYISDGIDSFGSDAGGISDDKLTSTTCAMQYAFDATYDTTKCTLSDGPKSIMFQNGKTYESVVFTVNGNDFEHLANTTNSIVMTNGFCTLNDFDTRVPEKPSSLQGYHVCPISESATEDELTTDQLIVDALNDVAGALRDIATEEMQGDIDEFKCEVLGGSYTLYGDGGSCTKNLDDNVATLDVINYLDSNN